MGSLGGVGNGRGRENQPANQRLRLGEDIAELRQSRHLASRTRFDSQMKRPDLAGWTATPTQMLDSTRSLWNDRPAVRTMGDPDAEHV